MECSRSKLTGAEGDAVADHVRRLRRAASLVAAVTNAEAEARLVAVAGRVAGGAAKVRSGGRNHALDASSLLVWRSLAFCSKNKK